MPKRILVVALEKRCEALRMAAGLTLLDDSVRVALCATVDSEADEHLEALDFADVPVERLDTTTDEGVRALAREIVDSDAVYVV